MKTELSPSYIPRQMDKWTWPNTWWSAHTNFHHCFILGILQPGINYTVYPSTKVEETSEISQHVRHSSPRQKCLEICTGLEVCKAINFMSTSWKTGVCNLYSGQQTQFIKDDNWVYFQLESWGLWIFNLQKMIDEWWQSSCLHVFLFKLCIEWQADWYRFVEYI